MPATVRRKSEHDVRGGENRQQQHVSGCHRWLPCKSYLCTPMFLFTVTVYVPETHAKPLATIAVQHADTGNNRRRSESQCSTS